jgi:hypothetical protein
VSECTRGTLLYADRGRKGRSKSKEESKAGKGGKRKRRGVRP